MYRQKGHAMKPTLDQYLQFLIDLTGLVILLVIFGGLLFVGLCV